MDAYCTMCKQKREMEQAQAVWLKNGRPATVGHCPRCGSVLTRLGQTSEHSTSPKPEVSRSDPLEPLTVTLPGLPSMVTSTPVSAPIEAYCIHCRANHPIVEGKATYVAHGRAIVRGRCAVCAASMFRMGATADHKRLNIRALSLSWVTTHALERHGVFTVEQLLNLSETDRRAIRYPTLDGAAEVDSVLRNASSSNAMLSRKDGSPSNENAQSPLLRSVTSSTAVSGGPVDMSDLSTQTSHTLWRAGYRSIEELVDLSDDELSAIPGLDSIAVAEIRMTLNQSYHLAHPVTRSVAATESSTVTPASKPNRGESIDTSERSSNIPASPRDIGPSPATSKSLERMDLSTHKGLANLSEPDLRLNSDIASTDVAEILQAQDRHGARLFKQSEPDLSVVRRVGNPPDSTTDTTAAMHPATTLGATSLDALDLPKRCYNALRRAGYDYVEQISNQSDEELLHVRNLGGNSLVSLRSALDQWTAHKAEHRLAGNKDELTVLLTEGVQVSENQLVVPSFVSLRSTPNDPLVSQEAVNFLLRLGCPAGEIHAGRVTVSQTTRSQLRQLGMHTVLDVTRASRASMQTVLSMADFRGFVSDVEYYVRWLGAQSDWRSEVNQENPSPVALLHLRQEEWEGLLSAFLAALNTNQRRVIQLRYGLDGGSFRTLQEVAIELLLTRGRVQQIEVRGLHELRRQLRSHEVLGAFVWLSRMSLQRDPLKHAATLLAELSAYLPANAQLTRGQLRLLLEGVAEAVHYRDNKDVFVSLTSPFDVDILIGTLRSTLYRARAPMRLAELADAVQRKWLGNAVPTIDQIATCLAAAPEFVNVEEDYWGLDYWNRHISNDIVMILRRLGRPAHYHELTELLNARLPEAERKSERNVLAQLQRLTDLFVRTAPGTFGLREQQPGASDRPIKYIDLVAQVLEEAGEPLLAEEVFELVNARRTAKRSSITMYLCMNPRFRKFDGNRYGLAAWTADSLQPQEEARCVSKDLTDDFTDELKQRVLTWIHNNSM